MKLTLHKSQVHSYGVMQWWACSSLMSPPLPAEAGCESRERIVVLFFLYCVTIPGQQTCKRFTFCYGSRRFVAWDCWTHTSWQVMQRDNDMLIAVSHVHLYFVKRSMSEFIAVLPQVWKIQCYCECHQRARVSNYTYAGVLWCSTKLRSLVEYSYDVCNMISTVVQYALASSFHLKSAEDCYELVKIRKQSMGQIANTNNPNAIHSYEISLDVSKLNVFIVSEIQAITWQVMDADRIRDEPYRV